jgi:hypothetical protein
MIKIRKEKNRNAHSSEGVDEIECYQLEFIKQREPG